MVACFGGRNGKEHTGNEPEIEEALAVLPGGTVLDGELVWDDGKLTGSRSAKVSRYVIFDVLAISAELRLVASVLLAVAASEAGHHHRASSPRRLRRSSASA